MNEIIGYKAGKEMEWIELNLLKNKAALSKADLIVLSGTDEIEVDSWISEAEIRSTLYKNPLYFVDNNRIIPNFSWSDIPEYFLCLYYSFNGANDKSGGTKLFEKISANALKHFLNGDVYTLGFPSNKNLNTYLDEIAQNCFEKRNILADSDYNDDGVDVVGYKTFGDKRSSNLYVLLQCAAGKHWTTKSPIAIERWTNYLIWYQKNIVQSISTVEFVKKSDWDKRASTYGMLFDRIRIYNSLYANAVDSVLRKEVLDWCQTKIDEGI